MIIRTEESVRCSKEIFIRSLAGIEDVLEWSINDLTRDRLRVVYDICNTRIGDIYGLVLKPIRGNSFIMSYPSVQRDMARMELHLKHFEELLKDFRRCVYGIFLNRQKVLILLGRMSEVVEAIRYTYPDVCYFHEGC